MDKPEHMDENLAAVDLVLTSDDLREIDTAASQIAVQGERLDAGLLSLSED
jgi:diketogulonate reductase-like aldo/keto reductase